jgi:extracellular factor (EF) 3-hydroxypalmitic acid methyl ester biosynthesis protein
MALNKELQFVEYLVVQHGPRPADYPVLDEWFHRIQQHSLSGALTAADLLRLHEAFGDAFSPRTLQGFSFHRPHGYAGDFEIIDKIYVRHHSPDPRLIRWDAYFHSQPAPKAVRNRKTYFHNLLDRRYSGRRPLRVLEVASGSGRCLFEWLSAHLDADISIHCLELDPNAIEYATVLNQEFASKVSFERKNLLRYRPSSQYDLVWAAGLFDYFGDRVFQAALRRLLPAVADGGELIIGNFTSGHRSQAYMEFAGWFLHHRSGEQLTALAQRCAVDRDAIHIGAEPEGVNLFLHIRPQ